MNPETSDESKSGEEIIMSGHASHCGGPAYLKCASKTT